jgi:hypothetical protein
VSRILTFLDLDKRILPLTLSNHHRHARLVVLLDLLALALALSRLPFRTHHRLARIHPLDSLAIGLTTHTFTDLEAVFTSSNPTLQIII